MIQAQFQRNYANVESNRWIVNFDEEILSKVEPFSILDDMINFLIEKVDYKVDQINLGKKYSLSENETQIIMNFCRYCVKLKKIKKNGRISCFRIKNKCLIHENVNYLISKNVSVPEIIKILKIALEPNILMDEKKDKLPQICLKCFENVFNLLSKIRGSFYTSEFFDLIRENYGIFLITKEEFLGLFPTIIKIMKYNPHFVNKEKTCHFKIKDTYKFFNELYKVEILNSNNNLLDNYKVFPILEKEILEKIDFLKDLLNSKINDIPSTYFFSLEEKIIYIQEQLDFLLSNYSQKYSKKLRNKLSILLSVDLLNLAELFPLLTDPYLEEIFLDSKSEKIYLNHQRFGRLETSIFLREKEIDAIKSHLILESNKPLDHENPCLVHVINNKFFHCRFSIDTWPSHYLDFSLDIRKLKKNLFTLLDLVDLGTCNIEIAAFLTLLLLIKVNITIVGEVNSGKTTLLNSLDLMIPKSFRKIYVENTIETLEIPPKYAHQLKYRTNNVERVDNAKEIYKLLHRSGDFIILGEILNKEETKAFFHCLSAGLKGMQTTHCSTIEGLINRWLIHFEIKKENLEDLGIIVLLKKIKNKRRILQIAELRNCETSVDISNFYKFDPKKNNAWNKISIFSNSEIFDQINQFIDFSKEKYEKSMEILMEFFSNVERSKKVKYGMIEEILFKLQNVSPYIGCV